MCLFFERIEKMSASREKKNRQDLTQQEGYIDVKAQRAAEERQAQRKSSTLYIAIAVVFLIVAVILGVVKSGILQKNATALIIDGEEFTPAQVDYFYYTAYSDIRSSNYASYFGLDSNVALDKQPINDMAKTLLQISSDEEMTWDSYFKGMAKDNLAQTYHMSRLALDNGYTVASVQDEFDSTMDSLDSYAAQSGYSTKAYLKMIYGSNMTVGTFKDTLTMLLLANAYQMDQINSFTYTDAEMEAYYQNDKSCFDFADYEYIYFNGTASATTDADGNTVEPTEAESAAALAAAKDAVADAADRYAAGESLEDIAAAYSDIASYVHSTEASNAGTDVTSWVFDASRVAGDTTTLAINNTQYFVLFHSCGRPEYHAANVRHILFNADTSALDTTSATYDADVAAIWEQTRAKAQDALEQWKSGAKTADSFAELVGQLSEDPGSQTTGGLYSGITKGSNYVDSFKNWCFEDGRQVGDTGIIESTYGCHVMYLDSFSDTPYWKELVKSEMMNSDYQEWLESVVADVEIEEGSGMKYVG